MRNRKGFTLIELLAVITIMGILMLVAIPAVSRTIENTRRQTFANMSLQYIKAIKNEVSADQLTCGGKPISAVEPSNVYRSGTSYYQMYYYMFASDYNAGKDLMEQGGTSAWGGVPVRGVISIYKYNDSNNRSKYEYGIMITDSSGRGMGSVSNYNGYYKPYGFITEKSINRSAVKTKDENNRLNYYNNFYNPDSYSYSGPDFYSYGNNYNFTFTGSEYTSSFSYYTYWTKCTLNG